MQSYREVYDRLMLTCVGSGYPSATDDLLREQGIDVRPNDHIATSMSTLLVLYAERIKDLERRVLELENS